MKDEREATPQVSKVVHFRGYTPRVRNNWDADDIQQVRARLEWSPQQLADALGVARRDVEAWEAGTTTVPEATAKRLERISAPTWSGEEIKQRRLAKGWKQRELAEELGVSLRSVVSWEQDGASPQGRNLAQLVRILGDAFADDTAGHDDGPPEAELLLRDAGFTDTIRHLVELHQKAERAGINRVLRVEDTPLPPDFHADHDVVNGPLVDEQPDGSDSPSRGTRQHPGE